MPKHVTTDAKTLKQIGAICRSVLRAKHSPEEADRRVKNLKFTDAVKIWQENKD